MKASGSDGRAAGWPRGARVERCRDRHEPDVGVAASTHADKCEMERDIVSR